MSLVAAVVIFAVAWCVGLFILLPLGVRTHDEEGIEPEEGTVSSAPVRPFILRKMLGAILIGIAAVLLFWALHAWFGFSIHNLS